MNHSINPSSVKDKIAENKSTLISITDVNDLLLTELVGEDVMDESTQERILDGRTRTEINKRFFEWLSQCDDSSVYKIFLSKLREYGQKHIANLLDGTPGELPLSHKVRQSLQKNARELTRNIDLNSGLLDNLQALGVISEIDYQDIKAEMKPITRAKSLWDVLLRGSKEAFEKFKEEIVKTQPEMIKLIEHQEGSMDKPHVVQLKKHCDVLARCMDVNSLTIAYLESKSVIDSDMADSLKSTEKLLKKANQVYNFLLFKPKDLFDSFLLAMEENEQKHVANLLKENKSGQQPMSDGAHKRLVKVKPDLIKGIYNDITLINAIRSAQENAETDFAISENDFQVLTEKYVTKNDKNSALIDAVLRRTDYSLKSLEFALRETKQEPMADLIQEGIMFGADVKTTRTDKEEEIVPEFNKQIANNQSSKKAGSDEERRFAENYNFLASKNIPVIVSEVSDSIMIYSYFKRPADAEKYVEYFNSGRLRDIYETMLNLVLKIIERDNYEPLEAAIILKDEDKNIIQEFIDESSPVESATEEAFSPQDKFACPLCGKFTNISSSVPVLEDSSSAVCSSCGSINDDCSVINKDVVSKHKRLQDDLQLVSSCRSKSIELKESCERKRADFVRQMEESRAAVSKKCEDLKEKVENFKEMLLRDQERYKKHVEGVMGEQIRALESYGSVVSDFEDRLRHLTEHGTSLQICESFSALHERAVKLQKMHEQPLSNAVEIFQGNPKLPPLIPKHLEESRSVEICEKLVPEQRDFLVEYLDPEPGLLQRLIALRALSEETAAEIIRLPSHQDMNRRLIESIISDNKYQQLVSALAASKQSYLLNYMASQGKYDPKYGHNWPVLQLERNQLDSMKEQIPCLLIPIYFNWLQSMNVLNLWHVNLILSKPSPEAKCDALLEILKRGSLDDFVKVRNLLATYQVQSNLKPLVLQRSFLASSLESDSGLIDILKPCLGKEFRSIKTERSSVKRNLKLVDAVSGSNKYDEFVKALVETGQGHIANVLNSNGAYDQKFAGQWPAVYSTWWEILKKNKKSLVDNLKLLDFLDDLVSRNVISSKQKDALIKIQSKCGRNETFLDMLGRGSMENYSKAVEFFHAAGQNDVAVWLGRPLVPAFGHFQVQVQVNQVSIERERAELMSAFGEVFAFPQVGA